MIFQEPIASLNPCFTVGFQIGEALKTHLGLDRAARRERSIELLREVGISEPERRLSAFPHQLSGGMSQRVMIAMAIACRPKLLIADEPTTALDVTIQAQILDLLLRLQAETGMALVLITHSMGVVAETAHRVVVQYAGQQVERQEVHGPLRAPAPSLHGRAARRAARPRHGQPAAGHPRRRAGPGRPARRLPLQSALRLRHRALPQGGAAGAVDRARPGALPLSAQRAERRPHERRHRGRRPVAELRRRPRRVPPAGDRAGARRRDVLGRGGKDAGGRRRIRLREVDARAPHHHDRAGERRPASSSTASTSAHADRGALKALRTHGADRLPEPLRLAQPAPEDRHDPGGAARHQHQPRRRRAAGQGAARRWRASGSGRSITGAIRTCSPAASGSASPSPAR